MFKLSKESKKLPWCKWSQTSLLFDGFTFFSCMFPRSYIQVSDTFAIIVIFPGITLKFINSSRYNVFEYRFFVMGRIGKPCCILLNYQDFQYFLQEKLNKTVCNCGSSYDDFDNIFTSRLNKFSKK